MRCRECNKDRLVLIAGLCEECYLWEMCFTETSDDTISASENKNLLKEIKEMIEEIDREINE